MLSLLGFLVGCGPTDSPAPLDQVAPPTPPEVPDQPPVDPPPAPPVQEPDPRPTCDLGPTERPDAFELTLTHAGVTRRALIDLPPGYDGSTALPVVLNFHGLLMDASLQRAYTGLAEDTRARGWIAVHPDAHGGSWNLLPGSADPGFVAALLDALADELCVDPTRVYATGLSNGGFFSYTLGCTLSDRIAAIAPVAGTDANVFCPADRPIPLFHVHGTADAIVSYDGGWLYPSAPASVADWASNVNDCDADPVVTLDAPGVSCETRACGPSDEATLCTLPGVGHVWPGSTPIPLLPGSTAAMDANAAILDFFDRW